MGDLFDIGKAGINAYKDSLAATGQNIANVGTEGYARRDATIEEVSVASADILTISNKSGLGVRMSGITRSFDQFLDLQLQQASSSFSFSKSKGEMLDRLENVLIPQNATVGTRIQEFFTGLNDLAQDPSNSNSRKLVLAGANAVSTEISGLHNSLMDLKKLSHGTLNLAVQEFNATLESLSQVQNQILGHSNRLGAPNTLLDQRDNLVAKLSELSDISVEYANNGGITVSMGRLGNMGTLLAGTSHNKIEVNVDNGKISSFLKSQDGNRSVIQFSSGQLAGLIASERLVDSTTTELNSLAQKFVQEMNLVHNSGLDLEGNAGTDLFSLEGVSLEKMSGNLGNSSIRVEGFSKTLAGSKLTVEFDGNNSVWSVSGAGDQSISDFKSHLQLDNLTVEIQGNPKHGDKFVLNISNDDASNMQVLIVGSEKLAAAGLYTLEAGLQNSGNSELEIGYLAENDDFGSQAFEALFEDHRNASNPIRFNSSNFLGGIKNVSSIEDMAFLQPQTSLRVFTDISKLDASDSLTVKLSGVDYRYDLASVFSDLGSMKELAEILNTGGISSHGTSKSFEDLGLRAVASGTSLVISSASQPGTPSNFPELQSGSLGGANGILSARDESSADLAVFTREGVQISGKLLSEDEAAQLITVENGFAKEAVYRANHLPTVEGQGYLGSTINRKTTDGLDIVFLNAAGINDNVNNNVTVYGGGAFPSNRVQLTQPLTVTMDSGQSHEVSFEKGMMAGQIAEHLSKELSGLGISATSTNLVELTGITGLVEFDLFGHNAVGSSISSTIVGSSTTALVAQINSHTDVTGINAYSNGSSGVILESIDSGDITSKNLNLSDAGGIQVSQLSDTGEHLMNPKKTLKSGEHLVAGGIVLINSPSDFKAAYNGNVISSKNYGFEMGFANKAFDLEKGHTDITFYANGLIDGAFSNEKQIDAVASASKYSLTLSDFVSGGLAGNLVGEFSPELVDDFTSEAISKSLAADLRGQAVSTIFKGDSFDLTDGFPTDGSKIEFMLGEQKYSITLNLDDAVEVRASDVVIGDKVFSHTDGLNELVARSKFSISGPENDRLLAEFTSTPSGFQFIVSAKSGVVSGHGLTVASSNSAVEKANFHVSNTSISEIFTNEFSNTMASEADVGRIVIGGTEHTLAFNTITNQFTGPVGLPAGLTVSTVVSPSDASMVRLKLTVTAGSGSDPVRIKSSVNSSKYGISTLSGQLLVTGDGMRISHLGDQRVKSSVTVNSLASEVLNIDGLNGEDLIFASIGDRNPLSIGGITTLDEPLDREYSLEVNKADTNMIDIFDEATGHLVGARTIKNDNSTSFGGLTFDFKGTVEAGDAFKVLVSDNTADDSSNLKRMINLSLINQETGRGGYAELFGNLVTNTGAEIQANQQALEASEAAYQLALDSKAEFSGVDLDTEAARLMEQQQAYQALARVLTTARELLDTLLRSM